ncbi:F-box protein [Prunus yedoensis var. nudiflora]|uniref:F-box protein n=1 Tax=Prunus yedoensis var. nudiflora TaxID=2094558 RepID=A0A314YSS5_PRUYE|nr:F-box protein [Prunus yedoensis var. nudiflora]
MGRSRNRRRKKQKLVNLDWTELPRGILEIIFERLTVTDCISVSDVCKAWRHVVAQELAGWQSRGVPWLMMSGKDREVRTCISILQKQHWDIVLPEAYGRYCWGSYQDWLILVKHIGCFYLEISLLNPFSRNKTDLPKTWNFYHKIVLSGLPILENYVCMLVHGQCRELSFWVPGAESWLKHKLNGEPFEDAVFCDGSFYLISNDYNIWQIKSANIFASIRTYDAYEVKIDCHEVIMSEEQENSGVLKYLVESCGELLLVCRLFNTKAEAILETHDFKVYSLDFSLMSWKRVHDLGDKILFLGKCCSRSVSSTELGVAMRNRIYFSNDHAAPWWNEWDSDHLYGISARLNLNNAGRKDWGVFSLGNGIREDFCFRGNRDRWGPIWLTCPQWWCCRKLAVNRYSD